MSDQEELINCGACSGDGFVWRRNSRVICPHCQGEQRLTQTELDRRAGQLLDSLKPSLDPDPAVARFQKTARRRPSVLATDLEQQLLDNLGIRVSAGVPQDQLLPHEGGELSDEEKRLQAMLDAEQARADESEATLSRVRETDHPVMEQDLDTAMARALARSGIKASPGVPQNQLLPHEGGELSPREKEMQAALHAAEEQAERYRAEVAQIEAERQAERQERELKARLGFELYGLYKSGRFSLEQAENLAKRWRGVAVD